MKTILITSFDDGYKPLADITVPRMETWAKRHGLQFHCRLGAALPVPYGVHWFPMVDGLRFLEQGFDRVVALDVDQLVTNYDFDLAQIASNDERGFHASRDWGNDAPSDDEFSLCGTLWHQDCIKLARDVIAMEEEWRYRPFPAQAPLRHAANSHFHQFANLRVIHPRRVFNAVPAEVAPENVPEPWQPGDWCAHLTMLPLPERIQLAREILKKP